MEEFIPKTNPFMIATSIMLSNFTKTSDSQTTISLFMGIEGIDKSMTSIWKNDFAGEAVLD